MTIFNRVKNLIAGHSPRCPLRPPHRGGLGLDGPAPRESQGAPACPGSLTSTGGRTPVRSVTVRSWSSAGHPAMPSKHCRGHPAATVDSKAELEERIRLVSHVRVAGRATVRRDTRIRDLPR